jgi:hypothetical protein
LPGALSNLAQEVACLQEFWATFGIVTLSGLPITSLPGDAIHR